ncbi:MAG TPA: sigma factor [Polyangiaceae bacterium]
MNAALSLRPPTPNPRLAALLSDPAWIVQLQGVVRRRVADHAAVADIVQEVCADAIAQAGNLPESDGDAKKYMLGIARNKARMHARGSARRKQDAIDEEVHGARPPEPVEDRDLWRRIAARIPPTRAPTLTWFVRVSLGDSLAEIARDAGVDYPTAQARYLRMRKELRRHAMQLAAVAAIAVLAIGLSRTRPPQHEMLGAPPPEPEPTQSAPTAAPKTLERAAEIRRHALRACSEKKWAECLRTLDEARTLDADGDRTPEVQAARKAAAGRESR